MRKKKIFYAFILIWAVVGLAYIAADTVNNEYIWTRENDSPFVYVIAGPIIWGAYIALSLLGMIAYLIA